MPMNCKDARDLLLDHVYGALDDADETALRAHLAACDACRAALGDAVAQKNLLAEAARDDAPDLRFEPPRKPLVIFTRRRLTAAAAALVLCAAGALAWRDGEIRAAEEANPRVAVLAPTAIAPGEPAEFLVDVRTLRGKALSATVRLDVHGQDGRLVTRGSAATGVDGKARVVFDAGLGEPGEQLRVNVAAVLANGVTRSASTVVVRDGTRFLARVATDKPLYRPGEVVRVRAVALERARLLPGSAVPMRVAVVDPRGGKVAEQAIPSDRGVGAWEWQIPEGIAGGEYKLVLSGGDAAWQPFPATERKFVVRSYRVPRIKGDLELDRDSYGPGDSGELALSVERAEGGVPAGATLDAVVTVDGKVVAREKQTLAPSGRAAVKFALPKDIAEGRGQIAVVVTDGGSVETLAKTIPIALGRLDVAYFPEGGDLVAGLVNRVYFQVTEPQGEPADLTADVVDESGAKVGQARVDALGMGRFEFTPKAGSTYRLVATKPAAIRLAGDFPAVVKDGVALRALDEVTAPGAAIRVEVAATTAGRHALAAYCRGALIAQDTVDLAAGTPRVVAMKPASDVGGVVRITAFDAAGVPRAERLVSLAPKHRIDVDVRPSAAKFAPGDTVNVEVTTRDETGRAVAAVLGVAVADEAVIKLANDRDTANFPLHFLLGLEVEELEKADVYADGPDAARAADRLLGVQGWRRFAWKAPQEFIAKHADTGARVVVADASDAPQHADNLAAAESSVRYARRQADEKLGRAGVVGAFGLTFLAGLCAIAAGIATRRRGFALGGVLASGVVALVTTVFVVVPRMQGSDAVAKAVPMEAADVKFDGAPRPGARAPVPAPPEPDEELVDEIRFADEGWRQEGKDKVWIADFDAPEVFAGAAVVLGGKPPAEIRALALDLKKEVGHLANDDGFRRGRERALRLQRVVLARTYAHRRQPNADGTRTDFAEVLYWNPLLATDANGKATFDFDTSDSVTTFAVGVDAHDARGALAASAASIANRIPFFLEPKLPVALSAGDVLRLPVVVANDTDAALDVNVGLALKGDLLKNTGAAAYGANVAPGTRGRVLYELVASHGRGDVALTLTGTARGLTDRSVRTIPVVPRGYPIDIAKGGVLEKAGYAVIHLPEDLDRASLVGSLRLYPSTLASLEDGMDSMLREPGGCFEQASSSNYPNVLVLNYLNESGGGSPEALRRAKDMLGRGYALLTGYECKQRGYEWFGGDPGHEALSAYGLMEFADMARVHPVDAAMVSRTRDWLMSRRDGKGGFLRNDRALDTFGAAPAEITNAYVVWAITEADPAADVAKEVASVVERARTSDDPYLVALAARVASNRRLPDTKALLDRLASMQKEDGHFAGKSTSITSSSGINLDVETTALAALAFVTEPARLPNAESAVRFLVAQRKNGGSFGATQATILALRALVEHAKAGKRTATEHDIALKVNGAFIAKRHVAAGAPGAIVFEREVLDALVPGENRIEFTTTGAETLPWALAVRYHAVVPATDPDCAIGVETRLAEDSVAEGKTVRLDVTLTNRKQEGVPMTLARVGLPAGLEPREDQLKELKKSGAIDFYETRPREVTLYLRGMAPSAVKHVALDLVAAIPGEFEGPATSAYLYYADDRKTWTAPLRVVVKPPAR